MYGGNLNLVSSVSADGRMFLRDDTPATQPPEPIAVQPDVPPAGTVSFVRPRISFARESIMGIVIFAALCGLFITLFNTDYEMLAKRVQAFLDPEGFTRSEKISQAWLDRYNIVVSVPADMEADADSDGLTLYQEYLHLTEPLAPDTDADGTPDGQEITNGTNPRGLGVLDVDRDGMPDNWERERGLDPLRDDRSADPDDDGLSNIREFQHKLDPRNPDSDEDQFPDGTEIRNGYDPSAPGDIRPAVTITVPKIAVTVPMVWSASVLEEQMQIDLTKGASHYPQTSSPGQEGNMFIAAHSSNYAWVEGNFNYIFSKLDQVKPGDTFLVTVLQSNGAKIEHLYKATEQRVVQPDDPWIFAQTPHATATFSTCWPIGTRQKRLIVKADLVTAP